MQNGVQKILSFRYLLMGSALYFMLNMNQDDVLYTMLPMYHTSANGIVTGAVLTQGELRLPERLSRESGS